MIFEFIVILEGSYGFKNEFLKFIKLNARFNTTCWNLLIEVDYFFSFIDIFYPYFFKLFFIFFIVDVGAHRPKFFQFISLFLLFHQWKIEHGE